MSSTVYEAHPRLEDVGGGFTTAPDGMNVLEKNLLAGSLLSIRSSAPAMGDRESGLFKTCRC